MKEKPIRECDGCENPKDDRRWLGIDGVSLCEECVDKPDAGPKVDEESDLVVQLSGKLSELRAERDGLRDKNGNLKAERDNLKARLESSNKLNDSLQGWHARNDRLNDEVNKLWAENDKLKSEPADFGTILDLRAEHEEETERLKSDLANLREKFLDQKDEIAELTINVFDLGSKSKTEQDGIAIMNARLIEERDHADARRKEAQTACEEWRGKAQEWKDKCTSWSNYACSF